MRRWSRLSRQAAWTARVTCGRSAVLGGVLGLVACTAWGRPVAGSNPNDPADPGRDPYQHQVPVLDGSPVHNIGNILLHVTNFGLIGSRPGSNTTYSGAPSAQWPKGSSTEYLWAAGLWVGALKNGERRVTTGVGYTGTMIDFEFLPGRSELDRIYRTRELAPGGARKPAPNADDDRDGSIDED